MPPHTTLLFFPFFLGTHLPPHSLPPCCCGHAPYYLPFWFFLPPVHRIPDPLPVSYLPFWFRLVGVRWLVDCPNPFTSCRLPFSCCTLFLCVPPALAFSSLYGWIIVTIWFIRWPGLFTRAFPRILRLVPPSLPIYHHHLFGWLDFAVAFTVCGVATTAFPQFIIPHHRAVVCVCRGVTAFLPGVAFSYSLLPYPLCRILDSPSGVVVGFNVVMVA